MEPTVILDGARSPVSEGMALQIQIKPDPDVAVYGGNSAYGVVDAYGDAPDYKPDIKPSEGDLFLWGDTQEEIIDTNAPPCVLSYDDNPVLEDIPTIPLEQLLTDLWQITDCEVCVEKLCEDTDPVFAAAAFRYRQSLLQNAHELVVNGVSPASGAKKRKKKKKKGESEEVKEQGDEEACAMLDDVFNGMEPSQLFPDLNAYVSSFDDIADFVPDFGEQIPDLQLTDDVPIAMKPEEHKQLLGDGVDDGVCEPCTPSEARMKQEVLDFTEHGTTALTEESHGREKKDVLFPVLADIAASGNTRDLKNPPNKHLRPVAKKSSKPKPRVVVPDGVKLRELRVRLHDIEKLGSQFWYYDEKFRKSGSVAGRYRLILCMNREEHNRQKRERLKQAAESRSNSTMSGPVNGDVNSELCMKNGAMTLISSRPTSEASQENHSHDRHRRHKDKKKSHRKSKSPRKSEDVGETTGGKRSSPKHKNKRKLEEMARKIEGSPELKKTKLKAVHGSVEKKAAMHRRALLANPKKEGPVDSGALGGFRIPKKKPADGFSLPVSSSATAAAAASRENVKPDPSLPPLKPSWGQREKEKALHIRPWLQQASDKTAHPRSRTQLSPMPATSVSATIGPSSSPSSSGYGSSSSASASPSIGSSPPSAGDRKPAPNLVRAGPLSSKMKRLPLAKVVEKVGTSPAIAKSPSSQGGSLGRPDLQDKDMGSSAGGKAEMTTPVDPRHHLRHPPLATTSRSPNNSDGNSPGVRGSSPKMHHSDSGRSPSLEKGRDPRGRHSDDSHSSSVDRGRASGSDAKQASSSETAADRNSTPAGENGSESTRSSSDQRRRGEILAVVGPRRGNCDPRESKERERAQSNQRRIDGGRSRWDDPNRRETSAGPSSSDRQQDEDLRVLAVVRNHQPRAPRPPFGPPVWNRAPQSLAVRPSAGPLRMGDVDLRRIPHPGSYGPPQFGPMHVPVTPLLQPMGPFGLAVPHPMAYAGYETHRPPAPFLRMAPHGVPATFQGRHPMFNRGIRLPNREIIVLDDDDEPATRNGPMDSMLLPPPPPLPSSVTNRSTARDVDLRFERPSMSDGGLNPAFSNNESLRPASTSGTSSLASTREKPLEDIDERQFSVPQQPVIPITSLISDLGVDPVGKRHESKRDEEISLSRQFERILDDDQEPADNGREHEEDNMGLADRFQKMIENNQPEEPTRLSDICESMMNEDDDDLELNFDAGFSCSCADRTRCTCAPHFRV